MIEINESQLKTLAVMMTLQQENPHQAMTLRDIADVRGITFTGVAYQIHKLIELGLVSQMVQDRSRAKGSNTSRTIRVTCQFIPMMEDD